MDAPLLSLVLPTYQERENIERLLPEVVTVLADQPYEIVVVDDRSPDGTGEAVREFARRGYPARVITKERMEGIGAALRVGYSESRGAVICSMDADLSFDPRDLLRIYDRIQRGADLVVGTRHSEASAYDAPTRAVRIKRTVSVGGNRLLAALSGIPLTDFSGNFRAMRREVWQAIQTTENTNTLLFEMILKAYIKGFVVAEVPVRFADRRYGVSKLRLSREAPKFLRRLSHYLWLYRRELAERRRRSS